MAFKALLLTAAVIIAVPSAAFANHATSADEAFKEANEKMMHDMMKPMSGDPDKDFVMMMLAHHQGAIDMAKVELQIREGPDTARFVQKLIIEAQGKEIKEMKEHVALPIPDAAQLDGIQSDAELGVKVRSISTRLHIPPLCFRCFSYLASVGRAAQRRPGLAGVMLASTAWAFSCGLMVMA